MEKWMQSKPNPYVAKQLKPAFRNIAKPAHLFKDSDKDGVMNVFDCKPYNKKKQDVIMPQNFGGGMSDMYGRQERARLNKVYQKQVEEMQRQELLRLEQQRVELPRVQVIDNSRTIYKDTPYVTDGTGWYSSTSERGKEIMAPKVPVSSTGRSSAFPTTKVDPITRLKQEATTKGQNLFKVKK